MQMTGMKRWMCKLPTMLSFVAHFLHFTCRL